MSAKITLTPKQKAAMVAVHLYGFIFAKLHGTADVHHHPAVVGMLVSKGLLKEHKAPLYDRHYVFTASAEGLQWLADDAQPAAVKQEPKALPGVLVDLLPKDYMK